VDDAFDRTAILYFATQNQGNAVIDGSAMRAHDGDSFALEP
jgi:hypothetical protein